MTDAELSNLASETFIATDCSRTNSFLRARVPTSVQCVELTYKMNTEGSWIYVGGAASSAFTPHVVSPFQTWGAVFTKKTVVNGWHTGQ